jgi:hypothetical protein
MRLRRATLLLAAVLALAGCSRIDTLRLAHANGGTPVEWPAGTVSLTVPLVPLREPGAWLPVSVDGSAPVPFLLQASAGAIALTGARPAGPRPAGAGQLRLLEGLLPGIDGGLLVKQRRLALESLVLREQSLLLVDTAAWPHPRPRRGAAGVLGYDLFRRFAVELDLPAGQVVLHRPGAFDFSTATEVARLMVLDRRPYFEAAVESSGGPRQWLRLQFEPAAPVALCLDRRVRGGTVVIAGRTLVRSEGPCEPRASLGAGHDRDGVLGGGALQALVVIVDYEGGRIGFRAP